MFVCCECCVLSGRGLCDELITRPEESYRLWCVIVCDLENLKNAEAMTSIGSQRHSKKKKSLICNSLYVGDSGSIQLQMCTFLYIRIGILFTDQIYSTESAVLCPTNSMQRSVNSYSASQVIPTFYCT